MPSLLLILTEFPPSFGGMQTHALALCHHLHQRGYQIAVATYRVPPRTPLPHFPFPVHRCLSRLSYFANLNTLARLAHQHQAQLIYSSTVYYGQLAATTGLPLICRSAGNDVLRPWIAWPFARAATFANIAAFEHYLYPRWKRFDWPDRIERALFDARHQLMRHSALAMQRIFANSHFTAHQLQSLGVPPHRIEILPGGVDVSHFSPTQESKFTLRTRLGLPTSPRILLTACRLVPKKGLDTLLYALNILVRTEPNIQLLIVGEGHGRAACQDLIERLQLQSNAHLLGYIPHDQLPPYFHAADAFVLPSRIHTNPRTGLTDVETMGRALCEANAAGLPIVASNSGGIPSIIRDGWNGLLAEENSVEDLVARLQQLATNTTIAQTLRANGLARARHEFDWPILIDAHTRQFDALLRL